jgi:hypothetical protein
MTDPADDRVPQADGRYGGSIEQTLAGHAELEVMAVIREAWAATDGIKGMIVGGSLLVNAAVLLVMAVFAGTAADRSEVSEAILNLVMMVIVYPYMAGVFLLGLRRSVGLTVTFEEQFACYRRLLPIVTVGLLQSVITGLGLSLLILPGIYFAIALSLAVPLKAERDLPIFECLLLSLRLVNRKFTEVALLSLAAVGLMAVGLLSLIGWIWTMPWAVMILAIIYRQLAGHQPARTMGGVAF